MLAVYLPGDSFLHRQAVAPKMLCLALLTAVAFFSSSIYLNGTLLLFVVLLMMSVPQAFTSLIAVGGRAVIWMSVTLLVVHTISGDFLLGLAVAMRTVALFSLALLVSLSSSLHETLNVLKRALSPLRKLGVDSDSLSLLITLVMRFMPVLMAQWSRLSCSWQARSPHPPNWRLVAPWCLAAISIAEHCDDCLRARVPLKTL